MQINAILINMEIAKKNWMNNPSKMQLIAFTGLWLLGVLLLVLSVTDFFKESFFQKTSVIIYFLMIASTIATIKLHINYRKVRVLNSGSNLE
jgi:hypothetical protein